MTMCVSGAKTGVLFGPLWGVVIRAGTSEHVSVELKSAQ
jgi:hypothetical protein